MKGGAKVVVEPHRHEGVFIARGKEDALCTLNSAPGKVGGGNWTAYCSTGMYVLIVLAWPCCDAVRILLCFCVVDLHFKVILFHPPNMSVDYFFDLLPHYVDPY